MIAIKAQPSDHQASNLGASADVTCIIGCAVMTGAGAVINTANVQAGQSVVIFGVGGIGSS